MTKTVEQIKEKIRDLRKEKYQKQIEIQEKNPLEAMILLSERITLILLLAWIEE